MLQAQTDGTLLYTLYHTLHMGTYLTDLLQRFQTFWEVLHKMLDKDIPSLKGHCEPQQVFCALECLTIHDEYLDSPLSERKKKGLKTSD